MKKTLFALFFLLVFFSCKNNSDLDSNGEPKEIVIAVFGGSGDNSGSVKKAMEVFTGYLEKKLNKKVRVYVTTNYTSVIEALHSKKAHIGYLSPFSYILAAQNNDITPMVVVGEKGKQSIYHSIIFANKNSGISTIDQLKSRAKELTLAFSDPASTSGHLIPFSYFNSIGINPDSSFKQIIFAGSHAATVLSVASNKVDIGCSTREYGTDILIGKGLIKAKDITILWESAPIVASPIVIRKDINKIYAEKIKNIYLNLYKDDYSVFKSYIGLFHTNTNELSYISVEDSLYNGVRNIAKNIKDVELLKNR